MNPKSFYDDTMPKKLGADYEKARWHSSPLVEAQYEMTRKTLQRLLVPQVQHAKKILEVGPGAATWTKLMLKVNPTASYTLVDISTEMLKRAKSALGVTRVIQYVECDFVEYAPGETFDVFFSSRAFEYMPNKGDVVKKITSLLTSGGTGVIITKTPKGFLDLLFRRKVSPLHSGQISPRQLASMLSASGLSVLKVRMATATVPGVRSSYLNALFFKFFSWVPLWGPLTWFSESYAVSFSKP